MVTQRNSRISLAILVICLSLGSLAAMPMVSAFSPMVVEFSEVETENNNPSNQVEFDEELLLETILSATMAALLFSKFRCLNLDFQTISLSPHFPPPKRS